MRRFAWSAVAACSLALFACSARSTSDASDDGGASPSGALSDGARDAGDAASADAAVNAAAPSVVDASAGRCDRLLSDVERLRAAAIACSLNVPEQMQCDQLAQDICCKVVVTGGTQAVDAFELAVRAFAEAKCPVDCKTPCPPSPTYSCEPLSATKGTCAQ